MPQPVHRRCPLLQISRADFKIRLLFHSRRPFGWFPADVCTGLGPEPGLQPTAGFIRWGEGCLQVKAAVRHPLSEAWRDSGDLPVSALLQASCSCSALRGAWWQGTGSVQTSWPSWEKSGTWVWFPYVLRHAGGGERAVWRYLKELGLQMHSVMLLLPVECIWTFKYRTLCKKCQISLA